MDATLLEGLRRLLEPATKGDPMRPLLWVSKSHAKLAAALCAMGHRIAKSSIPKLLGLLQYRRQVNRKTLEGSRNPDRDAQFEHINAAVIAAQAAGQPVISVDTKKKDARSAPCNSEPRYPWGVPKGAPGPGWPPGAGRLAADRSTLSRCGLVRSVIAPAFFIGPEWLPEQQVRLTR